MVVAIAQTVLAVLAAAEMQVHLVAQQEQPILVVAVAQAVVTRHQTAAQEAPALSSSATQAHSAAQAAR